MRVLHGHTFNILDLLFSATLSSGNSTILTGDIYEDPKLFFTLFHKDNAKNTNPWYLHCEVLYTFISLCVQLIT